MTDAMMKKAAEAIKEFRQDYPNMLVHGWGFHHYGNDYTISETENGTFRLFRCDLYSFHETFIEEFTI